MHRSLLALGISYAILAGCSSQPSSVADTPEQLVEDETQTQNVAEPEPQINFTPLDGRTVFRILVAEMALDRQEYYLGMNEYLNLARETQDPGAAQRAAEIATLLRQPQHALEASEIWISALPEEARPYLIATGAAIRVSDFNKAEAFFNQLLLLEPNTSIDGMVGQAGSLDGPQKQAVFNLYSLGVELAPNNETLWLEKARVERALQMFEAASGSVDESIKLAPGAQNYLFKAQLELDNGEESKAQKTLFKALETFPYERDLVIFNARVSSSLQKPEASLESLNTYYESFPEDHGVTALYARIALETEDIELAEPLFMDLLSASNHIDEANYFLAIIAQDKGNDDQALAYFSNVSKQPYLVPAALERVRTMVRSGDEEFALQLIDDYMNAHPELNVRWLNLEADTLIMLEKREQAFTVLSEGLILNPGNETLLYSRALLAETLGKTEVLIEDLSEILAQDPDNVRALNALGYTYADKDIKLDEAARMINKAHELNPNDPAIMDSKGWLLYRQGQLEAALEYLQKAFDITTNHEIAAHLGEVLWMLGRTEDAQNVWDQGLIDNPDSPILDETMKRLKTD